MLTAVSLLQIGRGELIRCRTLLTEAEDDARARSAQTVFGALRCPKHLIRLRLP
jgi:hypothetical protein